MPAQEQAYRRQRALLWVATGHDDYGSATVAGPVELWVRWNTKRVETVDREGTVVALDAVVQVDRQIPIDSAMWLAPDASYSALEQFYGTGSGGEDTEVMQVKTYSAVPDIKNRAGEKSVGLMKYKDNPPALT